MGSGISMGVIAPEFGLASRLLPKIQTGWLFLCMVWLASVLLPLLCCINYSKF